MSRTFNVLLVISCVLAVVAAFIVSVRPAGTAAEPVSPKETMTPAPLPELIAIVEEPSLEGGIPRDIVLKTKQQNDIIYDVRKYTVKRGDSLWSISQEYGLKPETILWGNEWLSKAGILQIGDKLKILPVDGVLHTVKEDETLETLQSLHGTSAQEIIEYVGNNFDLTQPVKLVVGQEISIPGGTSPIFWSEAQPPSAETQAKYTGEFPNLGTGYFVWPLAPPYTLTQEYWGGHPALDIDTYSRQRIFVSDRGTVAFSGWDNTGYGNLVLIDHGNGYRTYYAHNEVTLVSAAQTVAQGQQIAESGSTGNSSGEHLDLRILYGGSFQNPLNYVP